VKGFAPERIFHAALLTLALVASASAQEAAERQIDRWIADLQSPDEAVANDAYYALLSFDAPSLANKEDDIVEALGRAAVPFDATELFRMMGEQAIVPLLRHVAGAPKDARRQIVEGLHSIAEQGQVSPASLVIASLEQALADPDPEVRRAAASFFEVSGCCARGAKSGLLASARRSGCRRPGVLRRRAGGHSARRRCFGPVDPPRSAARCGSSRSRVRSIRVVRLRRKADPSVVDALIRIAREGDDEARRRAIEALAKADRQPKVRAALV